MLLSAVSVLVVAQSSSEIPEGLMNNPVEKSVALLTLQPRSIITVHWKRLIDLIISLTI